MASADNEKALKEEEYFMAVAVLTSKQSCHGCKEEGACVVNTNSRLFGIGFNKLEQDDEEKIQLSVIEEALRENPNITPVGIKTIYTTFAPSKSCIEFVHDKWPTIKEIIYLRKALAPEHDDIKCRQYASSENHNVENIVIKMKCRFIGELDEPPKPLQIEERDRFFMLLAVLTSMRSHDDRTHVGACMINESNQVVGVGYNMMPQGLYDHVRTCWIRDTPDTGNKYHYVTFGILNAVLHNNEGVVTKGCRIYATLFPSNECAKIIATAGEPIKPLELITEEATKKSEESKLLQENSKKAAKSILVTIKCALRQYAGDLDDCPLTLQ